MKYADSIYDALKEHWVIDAHTHIDTGHATARGLYDILLYHMVISDLYSAGYPYGSRIDENPDEQKMKGRVENALDYLAKIKNTSCYWGVKIILADLYGFNEELTKDNWHKADAIIKERYENAGWMHEIAQKAKISKSCTELWRGSNGIKNDFFQYSLEWAFFTRCQWGRFDTPLLELEHAWNARQIGEPLPVTVKGEISFNKKIVTLEDIKSAMRDYCNRIPFDNIIAIASHWSTDLHYRYVGDDEMNYALKNRMTAGAADQEIYANYLQQLFLETMEKDERNVMLQFSIGAEPLPYETGSKLHSGTLFELAEVMAGHPRLRFQLFLANEAQSQSACTLARELPNVSLSGYWWHNFFPTSMRKIMSQRLDMVALNKQIGFFSDAYCMDWAYAKLKIVRKQLARVLAERVEAGQYSFEDAIEIADAILFDSPQELLKIKLS